MGILLYEMLRGRSPFHATTPWAMPEMKAMVMKALALDHTLPEAHLLRGDPRYASFERRFGWGFAAAT
jgi:hypothetical protein